MRESLKISPEIISAVMQSCAGDCVLIDWTCKANVVFFIRQMGHLMGKPTICIGENKDADQLRGNREADQRLCFRYSDSTIPLLLKSEISSF